MTWSARFRWIIIPLGALLFAIPLLIGWQQGTKAREAPAWHPLAFRGSMVHRMWAGSAEGLTRLYLWGPTLGLRRSVDGGRTWSPHLEDGLPHNVLGQVPLEGIALAENDARVVVAGLNVDNAAALYRLQQDDTWQKVRTLAEPVHGPLLMTQAAKGQYLAWGPILWRWTEENGEESWHIMHKWQDHTITAMTSTGGETPTLLIYAGELWRSTDGGETWYAVPNAPNNIRALRSQVHTSGVFYALAGTSVWRSEDGGNTWKRMVTPAEAIALDLPPIYQGVLYILDRSGRVWRYTPDEGQWVSIGGLGPGSARLFLADPTEPGMLYLAGSDGLWGMEDILPPVTPTPTPTYTFTPLPPTNTPTATATATATVTPTPPAAPPTEPPTPSPTFTPTLTSTPTPTYTPSLSFPAATPTPTPTAPPTPSTQPTLPATPTWTPTATYTFTPSLPPTPTPTPTRTPGPPPER